MEFPRVGKEENCDKKVSVRKLKALGGEAKRIKLDISLKWTLEKIKLIWIGQLQNHKTEKRIIKKEEKIHTRAIHTHFIITLRPAEPSRKKKKNEKIP